MLFLLTYQNVHTLKVDCESFEYSVFLLVLCDGYMTPWHEIFLLTGAIPQIFKNLEVGNDGKASSQMVKWSVVLFVWT